MSVLAAASFHPADFLPCIEAVHTHTHLCVCVIGLIVIDLFYFVPHHPRAWEAREDVLVFIQELSVLALVVHGAVGLGGTSGHQHQGAAARRAVEEALRTPVGQVVPQVSGGIF